MLQGYKKHGERIWNLRENALKKARRRLLYFLEIKSFIMFEREK